LLVKNWQFPAAGNMPAGALGVPAGYNWINYPAPPTLLYPTEGMRPNAQGIWDYAWAIQPAVVTRLTGLPGQNSPNPLSRFVNQYVVQIGNLLYDPSYGVTYAYTAANPLGAFEAAAIDGYEMDGVWNFNTTWMFRRQQADPATTAQRLRFGQLQLP